MTFTPEFRDYLARQDEQRVERAATMLTSLTEREQRLVREAAVMGFVRGKQQPSDTPVPGDRTIVLDVLMACDSAQDLYPTITGRTS